MIPFVFTLYRFARTIVREFKDPEFRALLFLVLVILGSGTLFYHDIEGWRWLDSLYFSVTTLTTVGFGDFSPHTDIGKLFTIIYIFVGLGVILGFIEVVYMHTQKDKSPTIAEILKNRMTGSETKVEEPQEPTPAA
jgi:hypothetical protein